MARTKHIAYKELNNKKGVCTKKYPKLSQKALNVLSKDNFSSANYSSANASSGRENGEKYTTRSQAKSGGNNGKRHVYGKIAQPQRRRIHRFRPGTVALREIRKF